MTKADCKLCENRGRVNGLSEDTFCSSCVHGEPWKKDYYKPISTIPEKMIDEKLKALLEGLKVENPVYWESRTAKELGDLGRCIHNGSMSRLDGQLLIDALIDCSDRLRIMQDNGRAKMLDNLAVQAADFALANVGVMKNE